MQISSSCNKKPFFKQKKQKPRIQSDIEERFYSLRRNLATGQKQIVSPQQQEAFNYSGSLFGTSLADLFGPYCDITTGVVRANSIVPYNWDMPVRSDSYSELTFSPRNGVDVFDFEGIFVSGDNPVFLEWWDNGDSRATLYALRYTFPTPTRDVMIFYEANAIIRLWEGCTVLDPWAIMWGQNPNGHLLMDYVFYEQPRGGQFPSFNSFNWHPGLRCRDTNFDYINKEKVFSGSMPVKQGVSGNLYIGISIQFHGEEGVRISTGPLENPEGGNFELAPPVWSLPLVQGGGFGVFYIMVPATNL